MRTRMTRTVTMAALAAAGALALGAGGAAAQDKPFRTMTLEDDRETLCEIPKPPPELTPTNGHQDAYMYWLEKMELQRRLETGECDCQVDVITWEEVGEFAIPWNADTSVGPATMRRTILAEIEALQARVREECAG